MRDLSRPDNATCPCGGVPAGIVYAACCAPFHRGEAQPPDAERLMRSRYSAYALGDAGWLRATWAAATCPADLDFDEPQPKWLGLTIRAARALDAGHAEVEFVARYKVGGRAQRLHERSRFERRDGRWWYVDGDLLGQA